MQSAPCNKQVRPATAGTGHADAGSVAERPPIRPTANWVGLRRDLEDANMRLPDRRSYRYIRRACPGTRHNAWSALGLFGLGLGLATSAGAESSLPIIGPGAVAAQPATPAPPPTYVEAVDEIGRTSFNASLTGAAIFATCITGRNALGGELNQAFQQDCNLIVGGSLDDVAGSAEALGQLTSDQIAAQNSAAARAAGIGIAVVQGRLERLRVADLGLGGDWERVAARGTPSSGGAASADFGFERFGAFFSVDYATGDEDSTLFQPGYDFDRWSFLAGLDYRFTPELVAGLAVRYEDSTYDFDNRRGRLTGDAWGILGYASYDLPNGVFVEGTLGYTSTDYSQRRSINYVIDGTVASQVARSDPSADVWTINVGAGYHWYQGPWTITPALRLNYVSNDVSGYQERTSDPFATGGSMAMQIAGTTYESLTSDLSVQVARAISHRTGVIVPHLRLGWIHEFDNDQQQVGARFVNDINQQPLLVLTNTPDRDYLELGVGLSAQFPQGRSAFLSYGTLLGYRDVTYHGISAGVRLEF